MVLQTLLWLLVDIAAVYRLTKLAIDDEILYEVRAKVWEKFPPETTKIGYLFTCAWCMSIWMGAGIFALRKVDPELANYVSSVLAASAATGIAISKQV